MLYLKYCWGTWAHACYMGCCAFEGTESARNQTWFTTWTARQGGHTLKWVVSVVCRWWCLQRKTCTTSSSTTASNSTKTARATNSTDKLFGWVLTARRPWPTNWRNRWLVLCGRLVFKLETWNLSALSKVLSPNLFHCFATVVVVVVLIIFFYDNALVVDRVRGESGIRENQVSDQ